MNAVILVSMIVSFLWGVGPVVQKHVLSRIHPKTMLLFYGISYLFCLIAYSIYNRESIYNDVMKNMSMRLFIIIMILGLVVGFIANVLYFHVLHKKESYIVNALVCSSPLVTLVLAYLFLKEKINMSGFFGVMFIIIGIILIAFNDSTSDEQFVGIHD